ncbi:MAG: hypothetical protein KGL11_10040 [Alphaproteobacteria bacterium]|nr:hypothetical protein [Alphaproteobacteria bacterium]
MEKRQTLVFDTKYGPCAPEEMFGFNRADSIEWARGREGDTRRRLMELRNQFRDRLRRDFPQDHTLSVLVDNDDLTYFLDLLGQICEREYSAPLRAMGLFYCELLKSEMNLDLHPSVFNAERV